MTRSIGIRRGQSALKKGRRTKKRTKTSFWRKFLSFIIALFFLIFFDKEAPRVVSWRIRLHPRLARWDKRREERATLKTDFPLARHSLLFHLIFLVKKVEQQLWCKLQPWSPFSAVSFQSSFVHLRANSYSGFWSRENWIRKRRKEPCARCEILKGCKRRLLSQKKMEKERGREQNCIVANEHATLVLH